MKPFQPPWGTCDWGDCDVDAVSWRWSAECDQWLPVCYDHQESPVTAVDRCSARYLDASTPSGWTRCMLDEGHGGPHEHVNMTRRIGWRPFAPTGGSAAVAADYGAGFTITPGIYGGFLIRHCGSDTWIATFADEGDAEWFVRSLVNAMTQHEVTDDGGEA